LAYWNPAASEDVAAVYGERLKRFIDLDTIRPCDNLSQLDGWRWLYIKQMAERIWLSSLRLLANLRWLAVVGQALTVAVVTGPMRMGIPAAPLWAGIGALVLFNLYATWRSRRGEAGASTIFLHMLVDIVVLTWLIAWSGGIENPFSSLFLLPIALSILALPVRWVWLTAAASALGYGVSALIGYELPHAQHSLIGDSFSLHKAGMLVNFVVSAVVVLVFLTRMAAAWRQSEREVARLREQFARNEGIVALATHAASVAHELNTPLGTLTLMVDDLIRDGGSDEQRLDFATLKSLLEICRDRVRELAAPADPDTQQGRKGHEALDHVIDRWQLIRPTIELQRSGSIHALGRVDPAIGHLLQALLNNAADASEHAGSPQVDLRLDLEGSNLVGEIRDYGVGFDQTQPVLPGTLFRTSKPDGLGIGLALSHATVERLGGELSMRGAVEGRGVRVTFRLPMGAHV
jgi:two-component system sensor histidine kinase RegB